MTVQNEQERLVADTLAFVQRLAEQPAETASPSTFGTVTTAPRVPRYATETDLRQEMRLRLEAFRNRQRFLEIEREAYYQQAMQRIRAVTESYAPL
jgi:hypothetical protein